MAIQLKTDEMLEILRGKSPGTYGAYKEMVEKTSSILAKEVAKILNCQCGEATFEGVVFAGTCAPFYPAFDGQECPIEFLDFDDREAWEEFLEEENNDA